ncbi:MAG: hydrogenase maturation nickel metallochaperone HypA [Gammaproteobacteria bacterium]
MHELAVCQALMGQVTQVAVDNDADRVLGVTVRLGPLSGIEAQLLKDAYPIAAAGTVAEGSELIIELMPVRVHCESCGADSDATINHLVCAACGDWHTRILSGDEMMLASVELERDGMGEGTPETVH